MIHKLKYNNKETALLDLMVKGVIQDKQYTDENHKLVVSESYYINGTQSVVYVGKIIDTPTKYDNEGNVTKKATYLKGFHVDVMTNDTIHFGNNEVTGVNFPAHKFK
mgnify:CR=1 FL=1